MEEQAAWRPFRAVAITTHPIPAYGGFQATVELLSRMADQYNAGSVPMHAHHDLTAPIRSRGVRATVRQRQDGYHELVLAGQIHADDWDRIRHLSGMSLTVIAPLGEVIGGEASEDLAVTIAADAGWFEDDAIIEAARITAAAIPSAPACAYQFGLIADPQIFIELSLAALQALGPNLAASALWEGLKHLLNRRRVPQRGDPTSKTVVNFSVTDHGWTAVVESNDPEVVSKAIEALADAATTALSARRAAGVPPPVRWDTDQGVWRPVASAEETSALRADPEVSSD